MNKVFASGANLNAGIAATVAVLGQQQDEALAVAEQAEAEAASAAEAENQAKADTFAGLDACLAHRSAQARAECWGQICQTNRDAQIRDKCNETREAAYSAKPDELAAELDRCLEVPDYAERGNCIATSCNFAYTNTNDATRRQCSLAQQASSQKTRPVPASASTQKNTADLQADLDKCLAGTSAMQRMQCVQERCTKLQGMTGVTNEDYMVCSNAQQKAYQ